MPDLSTTGLHDLAASIAADARHLIGGNLQKGTVHADVSAPWDRRLKVSYTQTGLDDLAAAVSAAHTARQGGRWHRSQARNCLLTLADLLAAEQDVFIGLICFENGKLESAARGEVLGAIAGLRYWAEQAPSESVVTRTEARLTRLTRDPLGVVAAITPFNMPLLMMVNKIGAALAAGNTVVCKPSPDTPLSALHFARLAAGAVPAGVLNILAGGPETGPALTASPEVSMVSFTGSIETGKAIMAAAAPTMKRLQLELGGNDPAIVCRDANVSDVAVNIFRSAFGSAGQACVAVKRVYVHEDLHDELAEELAALSARAVPGRPFSEDATMPALTTRRQLDHLRWLAEDSRKRGGKFIHTGAIDDTVGNFASPSIVTGLTDGAPLVDGEQFSPILPLVPFSDVDPVVDNVNAGRFGLGATVWTEDTERADRIAERLETGMIWVNALPHPDPTVPFGGARESGLGREGGQGGLDEFTEVKCTTFNSKEAQR
ncbi:aldehyde dehydrogenase family protein [Arthrobacter koreensis]|jgi:acyl-CoA reductase-like NAD-dependent aldehyde dehydrogenase|uniref:aldehyde dehydrogenase family protein n=1 Tax=Arthrobacter koreensis TaxID=199136 RepID=UPI000A4A7849|nr:aldehyde dehydrogenase family protein [Arthrobacter koreensis]